MQTVRTAIKAAFVAVGAGLLVLAVFIAVAQQALVMGLAVAAMGAICLAVPYLMVRTR